MEQESGEDPEHDGPAGSQPPPDSSQPGDTDVPASGAGSAGADASDDADAGTADDGESVFGPWDALEGTLGAAREREELRAMASLQSWSGAGLLGVIRALIREDDPPYLGRPRHGDLPDVWDDSLVAEIGLALAVSSPSAGRTTQAAWELGARLPGVELLLRDGTLDVARARLVTEVFEELSDEDAAKAEG